MHLRSVTLRDWKAYEAARFEFPAPTGQKNVILIGGQNGFGKTTFFEAVALGLFGRDGLRLVSRAAIAADEQGRSQSFRDFIERALNGRALQQGRSSCHIGLTFEDDSGSPIIIERTWHFSDSGRLRQGDNAETIRIMRGIDRRVVGPSLNEPDPQGWYRDWISRTFLPTHLAGFFLFDGEAASVYAERDMGVQVREGIEGLLGLTWLRALSDDLRKYALKRRSEVPRGVNADAISALEKKVSDLESEISAAEQRLLQIESELATTEAQFSALTRELAGYGTGTRAQLEELIEERKRQEAAYKQAEDALLRIVDSDLPLALSGKSLRERVIDRLQREQRREQWLAAANAGKARIDHVLGVIAINLNQVDPPLTITQAEGIRRAVRSALDQLWYPPPDDAADSFRHVHAMGSLSERTQLRLERAANVTSDTVSLLLDSMAQAAAALRQVNSAIQATQVTAPQLEEKRARITALHTRMRELSEEQGEKRNLISSRKEDLNQTRKELGRLTGQLDQSARPARLSKRAEEVAAMLDDLVAEAWPLQAKAVAASMTNSIRAMAHRHDYLNKVEITEDGQVWLLAPNGRNLREFDLSAGEKQIFTQALFAAIAHVCGKVFPLIIDTPLGRLDEDHRINVLKHLAARDGQVMLISTNTEVVGPYLDAIRHKIIKAYRIENVTDGDLGKSWPVEGYFSGQGF